VHVNQAERYGEIREVQHPLYISVNECIIRSSELKKNRQHNGEKKKWKNGTQ
jgi:hypothetical protein